MVWRLVKECLSAMIRPLRFITYSGRCVTVHHCELFVNIHNHRRFKHGVRGG